MKKHIKIIINSLIIVSVFALVIANPAYGFFDVRNTEYSLGFKLGSWLIAQSNPIEYLNNADTEVESTDGKSHDYLEYIVDLIWDNPEYDDARKLVDGDISPQFENYSNEDLLELIDTMIDYVNNFLEIDENSTVFFPPSASVPEINTAFNTALEPGQSTQFKSMLLLANLASQIHWAPVTFTLTLEAPGGEDISDFAVELLYSSLDGNAHNFGYQYIVADQTSWNVNRANESVERSANALVPVTANKHYNTQIYKNNSGNYIPAEFRHLIKVPSSGDWSRFCLGPNLYLGAPSGSGIGQQQQLHLSASPEREGAILLGKANGTRTTMRVGLFDRQPVAGLLTTVPLLVNVSRGVRLDSDGQPMQYNAPSVIPIITIRATAGDVWS